MSIQSSLHDKSANKSVDECNSNRNTFCYFNLSGPVLSVLLGANSPRKPAGETSPKGTVAIQSSSHEKSTDKSVDESKRNCPLL